MSWPVRWTEGAAHPPLLPALGGGPAERRRAAASTPSTTGRSRPRSPPCSPPWSTSCEAEGAAEAAALVAENLADELGRPEPHLALFDRFAARRAAAAATRTGGTAATPGPGRRRPGGHLLRPGGRGTGRRPGRVGGLRDPGVGHRLVQGRGAAPLVRDGRRRHRVLGCPRRHGRRPRGLGHGRAHAARRRRRRGGPVRPVAAPTRGGRCSTSARPRRPAQPSSVPTTETNETISPG